MRDIKRCEWPGNDSLMQNYHDKEWGVQLHDDKKLFEFLVLDTFQAGLSWKTVLKKRENFRKAFNNFRAKKIAEYTNKDKKRLINNAGIIRNRLKIESTITNAMKFLGIQKEFGSFDKYIWQFTNNKQKKNKFRSLREIPPRTPESDAMSKALKHRGFKFVGSTICYAFMQAIGMVNDHEVGCFRHKEV